MSRASTLILLGIFVILTPFSGLPMTIRSLLAVVFGAVIFGIGLSLRAQDVHKTSPETEPPPVSPPPPPADISPI